MSDKIVVISNAYNCDKGISCSNCDKKGLFSILNIADHDLPAYFNKEGKTENICLSDIIILPEGGDEPFSDSAKIEKDIKYVVFHNNKKKELFDGETWFKQSSHSNSDGNIFCNELLDLAESIKENNFNNYDACLNKIKKRFPDCIFEAKFNLLHCLMAQEGKNSVIGEIDLKNIYAHLSESDGDNKNTVNGILASLKNGENQLENLYKLRDILFPKKQH